MPISDEEAYRQGKQIAQDMVRGQYNPAKDYSDKAGSANKARLVGLVIILFVVLIASGVCWFFLT